jgi:hypothetical protein
MDLPRVSILMGCIKTLIALRKGIRAQAGTILSMLRQKQLRGKAFPKG